MLSITSSTVTMSAMRQSDNYGANLQQLYDPDLKDRLAKAHDILDVDRIAALVDGTKRNQTKINDKNDSLIIFVSSGAKSLRTHSNSM